MSFDIVHSNATLEHVGSYNNQIAFVKEAFRFYLKILLFLFKLQTDFIQ